MDNITVYVETAYHSSNLTNSTRNPNKNRKKSNVGFSIHFNVKPFNVKSVCIPKEETQQTLCASLKYYWEKLNLRIQPIGYIFFTVCAMFVPYG